MTSPTGIGRTDYLRYCDLLGLTADEALSPLERVTALPPWIGPEMCATVPARDRLRRWADAGSPVPTADMIQNRVVFVGDVEIRTVVVSALQQVPPPVTHHVLTVCWMFGTGWSSGGWNAIAPPVRGQLPEPLQLINLAGHGRDPEDLAGVCAHEFAHSFLLAPADAMEELEPVGEREQRWTYLQQMAVAVGRLDVFLEMTTRTERLAAACARAWGFTGRGADGEGCARRAHQRLFTNAYALPPLPTAGAGEKASCDSPESRDAL